MQAIETFERAGYTVAIHQDECPSSPAGWDTLGTLAYRTRRAAVNSDDLPGDPYGAGMFCNDCPACDGSGETDSGEACPVCGGQCEIFDGTIDCKRMHADVALCLPVRAYDTQGGTSLEIADSWEDANGWIFATDASVEMTGVLPADIPEALAGDLQAWEQWAQGDVYGLVMTHPDGTEIESVCGFYGYEYAEAEAKSWLEYGEVQEAEARLATLEAIPELANLKVC